MLAVSKMRAAVVCVVLAALGAAAALPVSAASSAEDRGMVWVRLSQPCQNARKDKQSPPEEDLSVCQQLMLTLQTKYVDPSQSPKDDTEANFYWFALGGLHAGIGGALGEIDKVRSRRVCDQVFAQEVASTKIKPEAWPAGYEEAVKVVEQSLIPAATKCHADWG